jgi:hypothetical protein
VTKRAPHRRGDLRGDDLPNARRFRKRDGSYRDDSDLVMALKSTDAFNLDRFDDALQITRWVPRPAETSLEAFSLILRGCALREKGQPADELKVLDDATAAAAAAKVPDVANS